MVTNGKIHTAYRKRMRMPHAAAALVCCLCLLLCALPARAGVTWSGDMRPPDPTTWTSTTIGNVGEYGIGTMDITAGGTVTSRHGFLGHYAGAYGTVTVDGAGSSWTNTESLTVGRYGSGLLNITNGGTVSCLDGTLGEISTAAGTVNVDGIGSSWMISDRLYSRGTTALNITNGGSVSGHSAGVASSTDSPSTITVEGAGSSFTLEESLGIGGILTISSGGTASNSWSHIGRGTASSATVTVNGAGSTWANTTLCVGDAGAGVLNISNGGSVTAEDQTFVAPPSQSAGTINFDNGTLTTTGLFCAPSDLTGTGTINTHGLVTDVDLVFDSTHGLNQVITLNADPGQNITVNLNVDGTDALGAGYGGTGTMSISDGVTVTSRHGYIGYKAGSDGTVSVNGAGSSWINSAYIYVGDYGSGVLSVTDGGSVINDHDAYVGYRSGSSGTVNVDGVGSSWTIGDDISVDHGVLNITNGGIVSSNDAWVGRWLGCSGTVSVDGVGATWANTRSLFVGNEGDGTLTIASGGAVSNSHSYLGRWSGTSGTATVDGAGSSWASSGDLYVGYDGAGELTITNGGTVNSATGMLGYASQGSGTVTVNGVGSSWTHTDSLTVGSSGQGTLCLHDGGVVSAGGNASFGSLALLEFGLSGVATESQLAVGGLTTLDGGLEVSLLGGYMPTPGSWFTLIDAGSLGGTFASVLFPDYQEWTIDYDTVLGDVAVGFVKRLGDFDGDNDADADDIDELCANLGDASYDLDGDNDADEDDLTFLIETLVALSDGSGRVGSKRGDFNLDGLVNATDLAIMKTTFGLSGDFGYAEGNANCDGVVNATDLAILKSTYGWSAPTGAVPEPATLGLLGLAGLALLRRRRG